jgi:hypothetical protein
MAGWRHHRLLGTLVVVLSLFMIVSGTASTASAGSLEDLLPNLFGAGGILLSPTSPGGVFHVPHFTAESADQLNVLNRSLRGQLSNVPLPSPAGGFTFQFDPALGTFVRSTESFGPIYAQRSEALGRGKLSLGFTYSRYTYDTLDGKDLEDGGLSLTFRHQEIAGDFAFERDFISAQIFAEVTSDVAVLSATYGILDNLDIAVALPIIRNEIRLRGVARILPDPATPPGTHLFANGTDTLAVRASDEAINVGDMLLRAKYNFYRTAPLSMAAGRKADVETGSTEDLTGIGTTRVSPTFIASGRVQRFSPHVNVGFHLGDTSVIENEFFYNVGFDWGVIDPVTLNFDILGRRIIDNQRPKAGSTKIADDNIVDAAIGFKVNPWRNTLLLFNVLVPLNSTGLRDSVTPLIGVEVTF